MEKITSPAPRIIIDYFADDIKKRKIPTGPKPSLAVIDFRDWKINGKERPIELVPLELLRYRKDNGRIASDVMDYERNHGRLKEDSKEAQEIIKKFLSEKDDKKTDELMKSIQHAGQDQPAIITCDGFLINGNRRKMVLELLHTKYPQDDRFITMKVVILPGKDDVGGPPTLLEIEKIENRYQLQSDGKAEYYSFDKALSIRRKVEIGMSIKEQLLDDPRFINMPEKELKEAIKEYEQEYLKPLECIDKYLSHLKREGLYSTISAGISDREGRWYAFYDYSKFREQLNNESKRVQWGVLEKEIGKIEDAAFKIIRKRELKDLPKVHEIMRRFSKYIRIQDSKKELLRLNDIELELPKEERFNKEGKEYDEREIDKRWGSKYETLITRQVKVADQLYSRTKDISAPITILEAALDKLNHEVLEDPDVGIDDVCKALKLAIQIRERAHELEQIFYSTKKKLDDLGKK
jgi:hypothetical protein